MAKAVSGLEGSKANRLEAIFGLLAFLPIVFIACGVF